VTWMSRILAIATVCNLLVDYAGAVAGGTVAGWPRVALIGSIFAALTAVLVAGIRQTAWASTLLTAAKLLLLVTLIAAGLLTYGSVDVVLGPSPAPGAFAGTVALLLFAFFGFESATMSAGETAEPQRNLPFAILASIAIVAGCYVLVQYVAIAGLPGLAASTRPVADLAVRLLGPGGGAAVAGAAIVMMLGTMLAVLLGASRMLMAMGEQQQLPAAVARLHPRLRTPVMAIGISAATAICASLLSTFAAAITITVATRLFGYIVVCAALPVLRRSNAPAAFRLRGGTAIAIASAVVSTSLLATTTVRELAATLAVTVLGWAGWVVYDHGKARHAPAQLEPVASQPPSAPV
jgi:APA family basic amino acid/polyamine antiporter